MLKFIIALLVLFVFSNCEFQKKDIDLILVIDSTTVKVDSISFYRIRFYKEPLSQDNLNIVCVGLDRDLYRNGKLQVAESRECISVMEEDNGKMIQLYQAYYTILSYNPYLSLDSLYIPVTAHGIFYYDAEEKEDE